MICAFLARGVRFIQAYFFFEEKMNTDRKAERLMGRFFGYVALERKRERATVIVRGDKCSSEFTIPMDRYGNVKEHTGEEISYSSQELVSGLTSPPKLQIGDYVIMDFCATTCIPLLWRRANEEEVALYSENS